MGMYDIVEYSIDCPMCGNPITEFKTKDLGRTSKRFTLKEFRKMVDLILGLNIGNEIILTAHCNHCKEEGYKVTVEISIYRRDEEGFILR